MLINWITYKIKSFINDCNILFINDKILVYTIKYYNVKYKSTSYQQTYQQPVDKSV